MKKVFTLLFLFISIFSAKSQTGTNIVISQVYGAGGNSGSVYTNDYVELFNPTGSAINMVNWSIQYNSATSTTTTWKKCLILNATIQPGQYFLAQQAQGSGGTTSLPTPDLIGPLSMSGTAGKVVLVSDTNDIAVSAPTTHVIDLVGFGTTANAYEGSGPTPAFGSNTNALFRANAGCTDANNNAADFSAATAAPRNSASPIHLCSGVIASPSVTAGTLTNFGSINVGAFSTSQSVNISGANLTGAPSTLTISSGSSNFQVSLDNTNWSSSVSLPYGSATLSSTPIYVRFTPQSAGPLSGTISITGGGLTAAVTISANGTGLSTGAPTISAGSLTAFGNVCTNTLAGPNSFTITGSNLTAADVTVAALNGFTYSTTLAGPYSASLSLPQSGGNFSQTIYVYFAPTAIQSYSGNISVGGGGITASVSVAANGAGANNPPSVTTGAASAVSYTSATLAGAIISNGCTSVTTYGIEYSTVNGFANGSGTPITATNLGGGNYSAPVSGLSIGTIYYYKAYATNSGGTTYGVQQTFTTLKPYLSGTPLTGFGNVCISSVAGPNSFNISSPFLTIGNIVVGPLDGYSFSTTANGTYSSTLTIAQTGGSFNQDVYVKFSPVLPIGYVGAIPVSGGGATSINVFVTGYPVNTPPSDSTVAAGNITINSAELSGSIFDFGCTPVTEYGIEYTGISGLPNGYGTKVPASSLNGNAFISYLSGLAPGSTYFYKSYATNLGGTSYGQEKSFTTTSLGYGLVIYNSPVVRGTDLHFSLSVGIPGGLSNGSYQVQLYNEEGQMLYQKNMTIFTGYIDQNLTVPFNLPVGVYHFRMIAPYGNVFAKKILVQ